MTAFELARLQSKYKPGLSPSPHQSLTRGAALAMEQWAPQQLTPERGCQHPSETQTATSPINLKTILCMLLISLLSSFFILGRICMQA